MTKTGRPPNTVGFLVTGEFVTEHGTTPAQAATLFDWCEAHGRAFPKNLEEEG